MRRVAVAVGVAVGLVAGVVVLGLRRLGDFDLPWHLALGRDLTASWHGDVLSYTFAGKPSPVEWVADGLLWLLFRAGGPVALQMLAATVAALLAFVVAKTVSASGSRDAAGRLFAVAAAAWALLVAAPWLVVRPALLGLLLVAVVALIIERRASLWMAIPVQLLAAQTHGFCVLGAGLLVGWAVYVLLCRLSRGRFPSLLPATDVRPMWPPLIAAAVTVIGPFGAGAFVAPFRVQGFDDSITEWAPTSFAVAVTVVPAFGLGVAVVAGMLLYGVWKRRTLSLWELGLVAAPLAMGLARVRLIPLFGILAVPVIVRRVGPVIARARSAPLVPVVLALAIAPSVALIPGTELGAGFDTANIPVRATAWLAEHHIAGRPFHFLPFGGEIALALHDHGIRVFIDGRTAWLYPRPFFEAYRRAEHDRAAFDALDGEYRFDWALVRARPGERFSEPLAGNPRFRMVYLDDCAAIYVRSDGKMAGLVAAGYQAIHHLTPETALIAAPPPAALLDHDARLALGQDPQSARAHFLDAVAARLLHEPARQAEAKSWLRAHDSSLALLLTD